MASHRRAVSRFVEFFAQVGRCSKSRTPTIYGGMSTAISTIKNRIRVSDDARYLTAGQIRERFGVSDMWIYRYIKQRDQSR
jgi:hypothetical protein